MVAGEWPRHWTAPAGGRYQARLRYRNAHGPINTGITAAVKILEMDCAGAAKQSEPLVMPHSAAEQESSAASFVARAGQSCTFSLGDGFNMGVASGLQQSIARGGITNEYVCNKLFTNGLASTLATNR